MLKEGFLVKRVSAGLRLGWGGRAPGTRSPVPCARLSTTCRGTRGRGGLAWDEAGETSREKGPGPGGDEGGLGQCSAASGGGTGVDVDISEQLDLCSPGPAFNPQDHRKMKTKP